MLYYMSLASCGPPETGHVPGHCVDAFRSDALAKTLTWGQGQWGKGELLEKKSRKDAWWELEQVLQEGGSRTFVCREAKWWVCMGHRFQYNKLIFGEYQMTHPEGKWYWWWEEIRICQINERIYYIDWTFSVQGSVRCLLDQHKHFDVYTCEEVSSTNSP